MTRIAKFFSAALALCLLAGCSPKTPQTPPAASRPTVSQPAASQPDGSASCGPNGVPATGMASYLGAMDPYGNGPRYGLMTLGGAPVTEPVCSQIWLMSYSADGLEDSVFLPVWKLTLPGADENGPEENGGLTALYADDGSWHTDFIYDGCLATPLGVFAGLEGNQRFVLLDAETGEERKSWTQEELGLDLGPYPDSFPWFTGDAFETAQWVDGKIFLGTFGESEWTAWLLDPETDEVTEITSQEWYDAQESRYSDDGTWWQAEAEGENIAVIRHTGEEQEKSTFAAPFPPYVCYVLYAGGEPWVYLDEEGGRCALYTVRGEEVIPPQPGRLIHPLEDYAGTSPLRFALANPPELTVFDRTGKRLYAVPFGELDSERLSGGLLQVTDYETRAAYYNPETGEKIAEFSF